MPSEKILNMKKEKVAELSEKFKKAKKFPCTAAVQGITEVYEV